VSRKARVIHKLLARRHICSAEFATYTFQSFARRDNLVSLTFRTCPLEAKDCEKHCKYWIHYLTSLFYGPLSPLIFFRCSCLPKIIGLPVALMDRLGQTTMLITSSTVSCMPIIRIKRTNLAINCCWGVDFLIMGLGIGGGLLLP